MKRTKQGEAGGKGTPKVQITSREVTGMPKNPREGDEFHDTSVGVWYIFKGGSWQYVELP